MKKHPFVTLALALLTGACRSSQAVPTQSEHELRTALERYYADFSARDWVAVREHFWPDATLTTVWQPPGEPAARVVIHTIDEFLASTAEGPDSQPIFEERLLGANVRELNGLAQVWTTYEASFGAPGAVKTWRGWDAITWMEHDGRWRIVSLAFTNEPEETDVAP
jgi:hypothetical protein